MKRWYMPTSQQIIDRKLASGRALVHPDYTNITIGSTPLDGMIKPKAESFDAIINVSHSPEALFEPSRPDQRTYWYPVNEMGEWTYSYFVWLFAILDFHHSKKHKIYIHCHAGVYRSPEAVRLWLFYKGHSVLDSYLISRGYANLSAAKNFASGDGQTDEKKDSMMRYCLTQPWRLGNMPPKAQEFIRRLQHENRGPTGNIGYAYMEAAIAMKRVSHQLYGVRKKQESFFTTFKRKLGHKITDIKKAIKRYWNYETAIPCSKGVTSYEVDLARSANSRSMRGIRQLLKHTRLK